MSRLSILQLAILVTFLFTLITTSNAIPSPLEIEVRALGSPNQVHSQQLSPHQHQYRDQNSPVTTEISSYHSSEPDDLALVESPLAKRQRLIQQFRVATMFLLWSGTRLNSILNPSPHSDGVVFQSLKNMYTQIRRQHQVSSFLSNIKFDFDQNKSGCGGLGDWAALATSGT